MESLLVAEQLRYAGVLEAIRVSRVGFSQRFSNESFINRYGFLAAGSLKDTALEAKIDALINEAAKRSFTDQNPGVAL